MLFMWLLCRKDRLRELFLERMIMVCFELFMIPKCGGFSINGCVEYSMVVVVIGNQGELV